jgi:ribose-phosphate pyrophosphokinase
MVDTAGTLCTAAGLLKDAGARRVFAFASHGVLSGPATDRISKSALTELVVLDTVPLSDKAKVSNTNRNSMILFFHHDYYGLCF